MLTPLAGPLTHHADGGAVGAAGAGASGHVHLPFCMLVHYPVAAVSGWWSDYGGGRSETGKGVPGVGKNGFGGGVEVVGAGDGFVTGGEVGVGGMG